MAMPASLTHDILHGPPPPIDTGWGGGDHRGGAGRGASRAASFTGLFVLLAASTMAFAAFTSAFVVRSEERRVGKECRSRWSRYHLKKKKKVEPGNQRGGDKHAAGDTTKRALQQV